MRKSERAYKLGLWVSRNMVQECLFSRVLRELRGQEGRGQQLPRALPCARQCANVFTCIMLSNLCTVTLDCSYYYYFHFTEDETKSQNGEATFPRPPD